MACKQKQTLIGMQDPLLYNVNLVYPVTYMSQNNFGDRSTGHALKTIFIHWACDKS